MAPDIAPVKSALPPEWPRLSRLSLTSEGCSTHVHLPALLLCVNFVAAPVPRARLAAPVPRATWRLGAIPPASFLPTREGATHNPLPPCDMVARIGVGATPYVVSPTVPLERLPAKIRCCARPPLHPSLPRYLLSHHDPQRKDTSDFRASCARVSVHCLAGRFRVVPRRRPSSDLVVRALHVPGGSRRVESAHVWPAKRRESGWNV